MAHLLSIKVSVQRQMEIGCEDAARYMSNNSNSRDSDTDYSSTCDGRHSDQSKKHEIKQHYHKCAYDRKVGMQQMRSPSFGL